MLSWSCCVEDYQRNLVGSSCDDDACASYILKTAGSYTLSILSREDYPNLLVIIHALPENPNFCYQHATEKFT